MRGCVAYQSEFCLTSIGSNRVNTKLKSKFSICHPVLRVRGDIPSVSSEFQLKKKQKNKINENKTKCTKNKTKQTKTKQNIQKTKQNIQKTKQTKNKVLW